MALSYMVRKAIYGDAHDGTSDLSRCTRARKQFLPQRVHVCLLLIKWSYRDMGKVEVEIDH